MINLNNKRAKVIKNMKQRSKKNFSLFVCCICAFVIIAIAVGTGYTLAFFSHSVKTGPQSLSFGTIAIQEGSNATTIELGSVLPGEIKSSSDSGAYVSFKTTDNSLPCYLRVKIAIVCEKNGSSTELTEAEKKFVNSLKIGNNKEEDIILGLSENTNSKWVLDNDGYYYFVATSNTNNLQPVSAGTNIDFLKSVTFPKNIKNEIVVNETTFTNVQNGLTFKFDITCQAIQSAHVDPTLNDTTKDIFNSIQ